MNGSEAAGSTLPSHSNKWREFFQCCRNSSTTPLSKDTTFQLNMKILGILSRLSGKLQLTVLVYISTSDGLHQPADLLGSNQGSRARPGP